MKAYVLCDYEVDGLRVEGQSNRIRAVIFAFDSTKIDCKARIIGRGNATELLEFGQLAQGNYTARSIFVWCTSS